MRAPSPSLSQLATSFVSPQAQQFTYWRLYTGMFSHILHDYARRSSQAPWGAPTTSFIRHFRDALHRCCEDLCNRTILV